MTLTTFELTALGTKRDFTRVGYKRLVKRPSPLKNQASFFVNLTVINPFRSYVGPSDIIIFLFPTLFLIFNSFQSNFSATRILPRSYLFWAGKWLVGYL
jgi:hypothetical protein